MLPIMNIKLKLWSTIGWDSLASDKGGAARRIYWMNCYDPRESLAGIRARERRDRENKKAERLRRH